MTEDYFIHIMDLKVPKVKECVTPNSDGTYSIFIDAKLSREEQLQVAMHALKHIYGNDFMRESADSIEYNAHQ